MTDPMAEIRASFFIECEELLESLQDALTILQDGEGDDETINVVFRAVHSIKGGAGAFGLDALVGFAHRFETVLDALRAGKLALSDQVTALFFQGADLLADQVVAARDALPPPAGSEAVLTDLEALLGDMPVETEEPVDFAPAGLDFSFGDLDDIAPDAAQPQGESGWKITFHPLPGFYESGNDALPHLRALAALGPTEITCLQGDLRLDPALAEHPELGWQVRLTAPVDEAAIRAVFDFVMDVCDLTICPLHDPDHPGGGMDLPELSFEAPPPAPVADPADSIRGAVLSAVRATPATPEAPATIPETAPVTEASAQPTEPRSGEARAAQDSPAPTVRVDLERVDRLVNLVGELVINQAMLAQSVSDAGLDTAPAVVNGLDEFMNLTRDIQDSVMMIRAQPVKSLFQRMSRIVREASGAVGKKVRLVTRGETTEIDKTVLERLADPLTHMIRNAVDHGLETSEGRHDSGKSDTGTITLSASHRAGRVLIEVSDDGRGIDRERVFSIAVNRGLIDAEAQLTEAEIDNLLFLPGFSTASQVSALSGRGVGMDVVKNAISALGGKISITSERGTGTTFSISLPLTLAVLDGMVIRAADQTMVMPISSIVETSTLSDHKREKIGPYTTVIRLRGDILPLIDLADRLGFSRPPDAPDPGVVLLTASDDGTRTAFIVDAIMDQRQVVIKGLGDHFSHIPGVAAATILGDGQIALILDPSDMSGANARTSQPAILAGEAA
ncbi:MAG: chemotaxis protein CheA [Paracoccus sp. (in: a-proteobacteria)]|uniref:chemotaxis protein CheA n=1 Tax=Paracoccus sp. TaxID=267 RepID=UPI0026DFEE81|nr:chemotaxis protein CheA [Paracoccus sp. (in: a-proteobacteria)]MDO5622027.1 chemotaxis protein CheA [Paracoccus sp. (in: a-proteobacteria)]